MEKLFYPAQFLDQDNNEALGDLKTSFFDYFIEEEELHINKIIFFTTDEKYLTWEFDEEDAKNPKNVK